jgi:hypothetical protein
MSARSLTFLADPCFGGVATVYNDMGFITTSVPEFATMLLLGLGLMGLTGEEPGESLRDNETHNQFNCKKAVSEG